MPLSSIQTEALQVLARTRDPESYVAGSTPLNRSSVRFSQDIDIFHDDAQRVAAQAETDVENLRQAGFEVSWVRRLAVLHAAALSKDGAQTKLEWASDSDFRFFPTVPDPLFGYRLHPIDLAINKVFAAAGRREVRDIFDLSIVHHTIAPLGVLVWAGVEKSPGFTPEGLIEEVRRNLIHPRSAWEEIAAEAPIDPLAVTRQVQIALDEAAAFAARMPTDKLGVLFLDPQGRAVVPDPARLEDYVEHTGTRRGHWPTSEAIATELWARYRSDGA